MRKELKEAIASYRSLKSAKEGSREWHAWKCMNENVTYRLDQAASNQATIGLRVLIRVLRKMRSGTDAFHTLRGEPQLAILESAFVFEELEFEYVKKQAQPPGVFFSQEDLPAAFKGQQLIPFILFALPIVLSCFFSSANRANKAMHIAFVAENAALLHLVRSQKIKRIFDFAPYLIDHNWSYLLLENELDDFTKLPSPGPLSTHHGVLYCHSLLLSSAYQKEEIKVLKEVKYTQVDMWVPEYAFTYIDRYLETLPEPEPMTIGYYSHGGWLRRDEGHTDDGLNIPEAEEQLLKDLAKFTAEHDGWKVMIFPHPREKKPELVEKTREFYQQFFPDGNFALAGPDVRTSMSFEHVDIAAAAFSTILYERLFCGYKTLIGNYGMEHFPMKGSTLDGICFNSGEQLSKKLLELESVTRNEFFERYGLEAYRFDAYPYFVQA
ncbi:hypothetical protein [Sanyastnella coralliicola]|uniref:hypothetical protein n=1 Tax=Sanyastnella coralliicola TaxID=3069118 RepID=UPI0027B9693A|nr:hypothetical protein [Longitalea sp. SCSIO 12813]